MNVPDLILKKRNGEVLSDEEVNFLISGFVSRTIPDYQFSAFLMAGFFSGFNHKETVSLTKAMLYSGTLIDLSSIKGVKIGKHSTGGVGDKISFITAPVAAAAGVIVPKLSGRGLGHTGGTLDKLESLPGFNANLSLKQFKSVINKTGLVISGQTKDIVPADKMIYALRDVTATVDSIPYITASIMSKKLAEGTDGLVLDVKTGSGAFMKDKKLAVKLAESMMNIAAGFRKKVICVISDMNQPLGKCVGNWVELQEAISVLRDENKSELYQLAVYLSGAMIFLAGKAKSIEEGRDISEKVISSGAALDKFVNMISAQGGDTDLLLNPEKYPASKYSEKVYSPSSGYVSGLDALSVGIAAAELGAGRTKKEDSIDHKAGIILHVKTGDKVRKGDVLAEINTDRKAAIDSASGKLTDAYSFSKQTVKKESIIKKTII